MDMTNAIRDVLILDVSWCKLQYYRCMHVLMLLLLRIYIYIFYIFFNLKAYFQLPASLTRSMAVSRESGFTFLGNLVVLSTLLYWDFPVRQKPR